MKAILSYFLTAVLSGSFGACMMALFVAGARADRRMSNEDLADLLSNSRCSECPLRYKCDGREEVDAAMCYKYWLRYIESEVAHGS